MKGRNVFLGHILAALVLTLLGLFAATQHVADSLGGQPALGPPMLVLAGRPVYAPWAWLGWALRFEPYAPKVFERASAITYGAFGLTFTVTLLLAVYRSRRRPSSNAHGSARWATAAELQRTGLLGDSGVVLGQTNDATYVAAPDAKGGIAFTMSTQGRLIRHDGPEHVFVFAPTRSGKGIGIVIPTLLAWRHSVLVYDIKKELWTATAGWRRRFSHCWRFEPTASDSVKFNPLLEIRRGDNEVRDTQNVADILVDPEGTSDRRNHWQTTAHTLLVGAILHVLYAEPDKSLHGVAAFLSDPGRRKSETLQLMLATKHLGDTAHPVVAAAAREVLNKSDNERSGVWSTAMACLGLYRDPIVARNTSTSDFRITDLMQADNPVSLYLVVPPSDIDRTRPLVRLMLNQIGRRLTEKMEFKGKGYKHRLLMLLDEFPSLGRLSFFETELAYLAGYGIKCLMIAQSLNQIEKAYGPNNAILDNAHIRVTYAALDERTARRISELLGQSTETKRQVNFSGTRLGPWLRNISESEQEFARSLLTPDEILRLPFDDALILVGGANPYRARKVMYYLDPRFKDRAWLPCPDSIRKQAAELLGRRTDSEWPTTSSPPVAPPVAPVAPDAFESTQAQHAAIARSFNPEAALSPTGMSVDSTAPDNGQPFTLPDDPSNFGPETSPGGFNGLLTTDP